MRTWMTGTLAALAIAVCGCANGETSEKFDFASSGKDLAQPPLDLTGLDLTGADLAGMVTCVGADLMNDSNNCGRCGRSCGAGVCALGRCPITALYPNLPKPVGVAVDATNVYWTDVGDGTTGHVMKAPIGGMGGTKVTVDSAIQNAGGIAITNNTILWVERGSTDANGRVRKSPIGTVTPADVATAQNSPITVVSDGTTVYWVNQGTVAANHLDGAIRKSNIATPAPADVGTATALKFPTILALSGTATLFFSEAGTDPAYTDGAISKTAVGGPSPTGFAANQNYPFGIAVDSTNVYWVNTQGSSVLKQPIGGGAAVTIANSQPNPIHIAVDTAGVYWTNQGTSDGMGGYTGGSVMFCSHAAGATPIQLAINQKWPIKLVLDGTNVYWTEAGSSPNFQDGAINKTPK